MGLNSNALFHTHLFCDHIWSHVELFKHKHDAGTSESPLLPTAHVTLSSNANAKFFRTAINQLQVGNG